MAADVSDIFYPGDPLQRQKSLVLSQMVFIALISDFRAVNHLSEFLKKEVKWDHVTTDLTALKMDRNETIRHNCEILLRRTEKLQEIVHKLDRIFQDRLETHLYWSLSNMHSDFSDTLAVADCAKDVLSDLLRSSGCVAVIATVIQRKMLKQNLSALKVMGSSLVAETVLSTIIEFLE